MFSYTRTRLRRRGGEVVGATTWVLAGRGRDLDQISVAIDQEAGSSFMSSGKRMLLVAPAVPWQRRQASWPQALRVAAPRRNRLRERPGTGQGEFQSSGQKRQQNFLQVIWLWRRALMNSKLFGRLHLMEAPGLPRCRLTASLIEEQKVKKKGGGYERLRVKI
jgi:hypothetical protein